MHLPRFSAILADMTPAPDPVSVSSTAPSLGVPPQKARRRGLARPLPVPMWWRDACGVFVWSTMLVVVALWVAGGGVQGLTQGGAALTSVGRLTGLVASDLLLIQVLLMARIPVVEKTYGQDELARRHRWVGFSSFNLMLVHIVAITMGYAATSPKGLWGTFVDFVVNYPGMLLAVAGTVALIGVTITSIRAARARLRYESWHLLHLYAYLGVGLALPHQLWTGKDFLTSTMATVFWWTLWAAAAASVLIWRVGQPLWRSLRHQLVVEQVHARERSGHHGRHAWPDAAQVTGTGWSVPSVAFPGRSRLHAGTPLLPVRGTRRPDASNHRSPPGGWISPACETEPGDEGAVRRPLRPATRGGAHSPQGSAHGFGHRHHADAGASGGTEPAARRRHLDLPRKLRAGPYPAGRADQPGWASSGTVVHRDRPQVDTSVQLAT